LEEEASGFGDPKRAKDGGGTRKELEVEVDVL